MVLGRCTIRENKSSHNAANEITLLVMKLKLFHNHAVVDDSV